MKTQKKNIYETKKTINLYFLLLGGFCPGSFYPGAYVRGGFCPRPCLEYKPVLYTLYLSLNTINGAYTSLLSSDVR